MAVLSFAYLRKSGAKKEIDEGVVSIQGEVVEKKETAAPEKVELRIVEKKKEEVSGKRYSTYRIPAIALTAKLSKVNYCQGCDRFSRAESGDVEGGYGWCLRVVDGEEVMRPIPKSAAVSRCWYWMEYEKEKTTC